MIPLTPVLFSWSFQPNPPSCLAPVYNSIRDDKSGMGKRLLLDSSRGPLLCDGYLEHPMKPSVELLPATKATLHWREGPLDARDLHVLHEVLKGKPLAAPYATHTIIEP